MKATNEQLIKEIDEISELNREARRRSNEVLSRVRGKLEHSDKKISDEYERGLEDAWELAKLFAIDDDKGGLHSKDINNIYGLHWWEVFKEYTAHDAMSAYKDWLKEKEEEAKKPKTGDVIEVIDDVGSYSEKGVFMSEGMDGFTYISKNGLVCVAKKANFSFRKTGEHVDILGMLDKI